MVKDKLKALIEERKAQEAALRGAGGSGGSPQGIPPQPAAMIPGGNGTG